MELTLLTCTEILGAGFFAFVVAMLLKNRHRTIAFLFVMASVFIIGFPAFAWLLPDPDPRLPSIFWFLSDICLLFFYTFICGKLGKVLLTKMINTSFLGSTDKGLTSATLPEDGTK